MMATGTVKFFNAQKGFGFIQPTDGSKDVFVHISAVERAGMRTLVEGQKVSYDVVTERGKQAAGNLQAAWPAAGSTDPNPSQTPGVQGRRAFLVFSDWRRRPYSEGTLPKVGS
jgi:cold shock protein